MAASWSREFEFPIPDPRGWSLGRRVRSRSPSTVAYIKNGIQRWTQIFLSLRAIQYIVNHFALCRQVDRDPNIVIADLSIIVPLCNAMPAPCPTIRTTIRLWKNCKSKCVCAFYRFLYHDSWLNVTPLDPGSSSVLGSDAHHDLSTVSRYVLNKEAGWLVVSKTCSVFTANHPTPPGVWLWLYLEQCYNQVYSVSLAIISFGMIMILLVRHYYVRTLKLWVCYQNVQKLGSACCLCY